MGLHLSNADVVLFIALSLGIALLLALRLRPASWRGIVLEALAANAAALAAVIALELALG